MQYEEATLIRNKYIDNQSVSEKKYLYIIVAPRNGADLFSFQKRLYQTGDINLSPKQFTTEDNFVVLGITAMSDGAFYYDFLD
jgi:hypothetical protein